MKKVFALAVVTMLTVTFNACTDSDLEKLQKQNEDLKLIEKDKVETPTTKG
ncbi:hypothetical protein ABMY20_15315 [Tenacibaculum sp. SSH1-16]|uniref:hypothetical protein n=1 Tax=Tenacibaculum sp. SSH1-16 TaxID=3136667 RepID=UPI0032C47C15